MKQFSNKKGETRQYINKRKGILQTSFLPIIGCIAFVVLISFLGKGEFKKFEQTKAEFKHSYTIEWENLYLTDKVSDFIKIDNGYILAEQNKSTLLFLDESFKPTNRVGRKGDGPSDFNTIGALDKVGDDIAVYDRGHARIVVMDQEGNIKRQVRSRHLAPKCFNFQVLKNNQVIFSIADEKEPIISIDLASEATQRFARSVPKRWNSIQARQGNKGFIKDFKDKFIYFPPTETFAEVFDSQFNSLYTVPFNDLDILEASQRRANDMYNTTNNKTLQYYSDVYQSGDKFYLMSYSDQVMPDGKYKRALDKVIELTFDEELRVSKVIELAEGRYYSQLVVEGNKIYAFNYHAFTIDEYEF